VTSLQQKRFASVVVGPAQNLLPAAIKTALHRNYRVKQQLLMGPHTHSARPKRGFGHRPEQLLVPR